MQPPLDAETNQSQPPPPQQGAPYPPPGYWPPYYAPPQNSTYAILSLVMGILGFVGLGIIGAIMALVFGNMAQKEIAQSQGRLIGDNFARIGIILGWIGIGLTVAVIVIIAIILLTVGLNSFHHIGA